MTENTFNTPDPFVTPPSDNDKLLAGLSWISQIIVPVVMPAILLFTDESKRSPFIKSHAVQSLGLMAAAVVYEILAVIVYAIASAVAPCLSCALWVLFLLPIVPLVYYGIKAFQGQEVEIPYLTKFIKDNHWL